MSQYVLNLKKKTLEVNPSPSILVSLGLLMQRGSDAVPRSRELFADAEHGDTAEGGVPVRWCALRASLMNPCASTWTTTVTSSRGASSKRQRLSIRTPMAGARSL